MGQFSFFVLHESLLLRRDWVREGVGIVCCGGGGWYAARRWWKSLDVDLVRGVVGWWEVADQRSHY